MNIGLKFIIIYGEDVNENSSNSSTKLDEDSLETSLAITPTNSISIVNKEIANNDDIEKNDESNVNEISPAEEIINYDEKMNKDANEKLKYNSRNQKEELMKL